MSVRRAVRAAVVTAVTAATAVTSTGVASAYWDYIGTNVRIRACQYTNCEIRGHGHHGHRLTLHSYVTNGSSVNGSRVWGNHTNNRTGIRGWSHGSYIGWYS